MGEITRTKKCSMCQNILDYSLFNKNKRTKDGLQTGCRECSKKYNSKWESCPINRRKRKLKTKYNMTEQDYQNLLLKQEGKCAICRTSDPKNKAYTRLVVDHNHATGNVRGLLCDYCNVGLGRFEDSIQRLKSAILYLKNEK